ncbi:MAG TPA: DUF4430 domain-containing protein [Solirubrobacteraceae bacterium]|jgi:hypothetical protein|nr:DUF4430 domain-containing protein [Solirubrobacteraceae bacterium]
MRAAIATLAVIALIGIPVADVARAAPTTVDVRIEGKAETLFEGLVRTEGHDVRASSDAQQRPCDGINTLDPENKTPGPTPTAASVDAMSLIGETFDGDWYPGYNDYFITRWGPDAQNPADGAYWGILVNDALTNVGGCQYELREGDEVLWVYNAFKGRENLALFPAGDTASRPPLTATAKLGEPFALEVEVYGDHREDSPPTEPDRKDATPYQGAEVSPVLTSAKGFERVQAESPEVVTTDSEGKASITFTTAGWHRIKAGTPLNEAGEEAAIRSNRIDVCVPAQGESGCGLPPAEDDVRIPPVLAGEPEAEHHEKPAETGTGCGDAAGGQPGCVGTISPATSGTTLQATPMQPPARQASAPAARLVLESITPRRLLLKLATAGTATVTITRREGSRHHPRWLAVRTLAVKVGKAGEVEVRLPRLAAGRYRVRVGLDGANSVARILTVPHRA